jgi:hypothetical protein
VDNEIHTTENRKLRERKKQQKYSRTTCHVKRSYSFNKSTAIIQIPWKQNKNKNKSDGHKDGLVRHETTVTWQN